MTRLAVLGAALVLLAGLAFLTVRVMIEDGFTVVVALAFLIIALIAFGVVGALTSPDE